MLNKDIVNEILRSCQNLTLSTNHGKFLADKSYGFDTMFFACRFINRFRFGNKYHKLELQERSNAYIQDLFCLTPNAGQVGNYFTEACALLKFAHILDDTTKQGVYQICNDSILEFIASGPENAYIFQYLLTYKVFKNDGIWDEYVNFCRAKTLNEKQNVYERIMQLFKKKDYRIKDPEKLWAIFIPKYPMNILNYINRENAITRTAKVKKEIVKRTDIALNVPGTRANYNLPKKNSYIDDLSDSYIIETLRPYLVKEMSCFSEIAPTDTFSIDVADTKLDMLEAKDGKLVKHNYPDEKYCYKKNGAKVRTVQGEFRSGLMKNTPHVCPICGFKFENFLIASHIKPYSVCEDTYDAINYNNGLLMCPICDKLFESANYITIDHKTGTVIYDSLIKDEKDFSYLKNRTIDYKYIDCERKHYLKWHNDAYYEKHNKVEEI